MSGSPEKPRAAKVYIEERLAERGWDQRTLARRMNRSESAVSKKLARPELIDLQWLSEFAAAFGVSVVEMFHPPGDKTAKLLSPRMAEFFDLASGLSDNQIGNLVDTFRALQGLGPPQEASPAPEAGPPPKATSTR